ncbi:MAG: Cna B-type domain-containing protein, partial [Vagococcus sp.]
MPEGKEYIQFSNTLKATFTRVGVTKTKSGGYYAELYRLSEPMIALSKERTGEESLFLNQKSSFYLSFTSTNLGTEGNRTSMALQNVVVVDILPLGAEYVENSAMIIPEKTNKQTELRALKKPQIIRDYKNTGRVALIWTLNDFNIETTSSKTDQEYFLYIIYDVKTTKNSVEGNNKNEAFLLFDSSDGVQPNKQKLVNDIYKIGKDKLNQILGASDSFNYIPPKELITYKEVKGNVDQGVVKSPGVGHSEIGEDGSYFLNIYNNSAYDQSILSVIDVFPHVGDKNSSKDKDGERKPRHSDFSIKLTGEIAVPEGYTLYYTTDEPNVSSEKINGFFQSASWQTQVADYGEVTAIKVVMDQGHKLKASASIRIEVPFTVPNNKELVGKSAVNSFGTATNSMLDFFESNNISLKLMKYRVDGFSFEDKNKDGLFDKATEKPCIGCHIELLDKAGSPVLDDKGMPIETLTDNFGYYSMDVYKHGDYQVRISTPDNSLITVKNPDEESGSHINQSEKSDMFSLDMLAPKKRVNGGYFVDPSNITSVTVTKKWEDEDNIDGNRPSTIKVQLLADGVKKDEVVELTEADKWTTTWSDLPLKAKGELINYTVEEEEEVPGYTVSFDDSDKGNIVLTNTHEPEKTKVEGKKIWEDNDNQDGKRKEKVTINLLANGKEVDSKDVTEAMGWSYQFTDLPKYVNGDEIKYTVTENQVSDYSTSISGYDVTNNYTPEKTSVTMTKNWEDKNDIDGHRPSIIKVQLLADGEEVGKAVDVTEADNWTKTWTDLPLKAKGELINYTVDEESVPGYVTTVDDTNKGNIKITNTHEPEKTKVEGKKIWEDNDNQDGKRKEKVTINLLANGKEVDSKDVTEAMGWSYQFIELPKYENGDEIKYTVTENQVPEYNTTIKGYDVINSYTPGKTSVTMTKSWEDNNNQDGKRPSIIKVQLLADGEKKGKVVDLTSADNWTKTWNDLPLKAKGELINYTVEEIAVPGYVTTVDDKDKGNVKLTNTHNPEVTTIKGKKTWQDNDNQDGKRPKSLKINLLANGKEVGSTEVTEASGWVYGFSQLPKYEAGKEIVYTVTENQIPEYSTTIKGYDVTNSYTPGKTSVTMTKSWEDNNNQDGKRPSIIKVQLLADGEKKGEVVDLTSADNWTKTWSSLPLKAKGKLINYTVKEIAVPGYVTTVDDTDKGNIKLTNSYQLEKTSVKGSKLWEDNDNQDGKRPNQVKVNLLANGKEVDSTEVTKATNWTYEFTELAKYESGKEITYTVTEDQVPEYNTTIKGYEITNRYTPGKTSVSVTKGWEDDNDRDRKRPSIIKVQLFANGEKKEKAVELSSGNKWTTTWNDLPLKAKGKLVRYTIEEVSDTGYQVTIDDTNPGNIKLTNTRQSEQTAIKGSKLWEDN